MQNVVGVELQAGKTTQKTIHNIKINNRNTSITIAGLKLTISYTFNVLIWDENKKKETQIIIIRRRFFGYCHSYQIANYVCTFISSDIAPAYVCTDFNTYE